MNKLILLLLLIWNLTVFFLYAMDKYRARKNAWRVSERALILGALLCGGVGAALGMALLRHKTRHLKFRLLVPLAAVLTLVVAAFLLWPQQLLELVKTASGALTRA